MTVPTSQGGIPVDLHDSELSGLAASDVFKAFGTQPVLRGVNLSVVPGSFTAILGPSGSGKTTLLRILAGFERADRGMVTIGEQVVDAPGRHVPAERRRIGYVSQEGSLFPHLNVAANVGFGLPRRQRSGLRVSELLDAVGLTGLGGRYPHQLSGGQQQRVALARALAISPRVVLMDEPFASLDASLRAAVRADVQRVLRETGATAVLVTHDQDEALSIADQVAVMRDGQIGQVGTPQDIYDHPANAEMARFLGDANLVDGVLVDVVTVRTDFGLLPIRSAPAHGIAADARELVELDAGAKVVVLIRPEQLSVETLPIDGETDIVMTARVVESSFHGHDTVVRVRPEPPCGTPSVVLRSDGGQPLAEGTAVGISVDGAVLVWRAVGG